MAERRQRQLARVPGFTPVRSVRLETWVARHLRGLIAQMKGKTELQLAAARLPADLDGAHAEAQHRALRFLPSAPMVRSLAVRPSKSDDAAYRKARPA